MSFSAPIRVAPPELRSLKAGEWIVCVNGHRVCQAMEDVDEGDSFWGIRFGNYLGREPDHGEAQQSCVCQHGCRFFYGQPMTTETYFKKHGFYYP